MFKLFFDGAANPNPGTMGVGASLIDQNDNEIDSVSLNCGTGTNNQAEYMALVEGVKLLKRNNVSSVLIVGDSRLVINQMTGVWNCNDTKLRELKKQALLHLDGCEVEYRWVRRNQNERADELSKQGLEKSVSDEPIQLNKKNKPKERLTPIQVFYHTGIGFSVIDGEKLYAVNLNPKVHCSCSSGNSQCRHISAALDYAQKQRAVA